MKIKKLFLVWIFFFSPSIFAFHLKNLKDVLVQQASQQLMVAIEADDV